MITPTDQQLKTFACEWWHKFGFVKDKATCCWALDVIDPDQFVDFARDILARWGSPAHVPVSEHLPGPKDCDNALDDLALRVQRLEQQRETEKAALLDAFKQIDRLQKCINFQYNKIHKLETSIESAFEKPYGN